ncbi:hypothetical protein EGI26_19390 [Lacihabitans sp. CCS-44]|uniref:hypothetical protein n=1 Tax=Lacihabitans sp. CCS-44 TaxID=2487331 RepID=UPI0020CF1C2D|nr:hypothetical protein [Lacihabitans sp. CCS-44]MCP9757331.1 hypothetical protein [Lacihabitans sp. CCS-44]
MNVTNTLKYPFKIKNRLAKVSKGIVKSLFALLTLALVALYYQSEIFSFSQTPINRPSSFYNPYQNWIKKKTLKANFHAHGQAWGGITNGHNSDDEIIKEYKKLGFSIAAVSNYHSISKINDTSLLYIPCYEQGFNVSKTHLLAIDATEAYNLDFPLGQSLSQKQTRILNLKKTASLVALTHPGLGEGFNTQDLKYLKGYDLMEVLSPYFESFDLWDYALNQGHLSWILANDDTHDLKKQPPGRFFNLIMTENKTKFDVVNALKNGNHVSYSSDKGIVDVSLEKISLKGNTLNYSFSGNINRVKLVRNGEVFMVDPHGQVILQETDKYVRFEVVGEKSVLYTNPIYRLKTSDVAEFSKIPYKIDILKTFAYRILVLLSGFAFLLILYRRKAATLSKPFLVKLLNFKFQQRKLEEI